MLYIDIILVILELLAAVSLYILAGIAVKALSSKWKICYVLPAIICMFFTAIAGFEASLLGVYAGVCLLIVGFVKEAASVRRIVSAISGVLILSAFPVSFLNSGYRAPDYAADFQMGFDIMKKYYVLAEYKGIDWDALYEEYLPKFQAVNESHDEVENDIVWQEFVREFYDGHVSFSPSSDEVAELAAGRVCGNDYGLSLMTLSDGRTVAVNVAEDGAAAAAGIHNGTVITAWDGQDIEEVKAQITYTVMVFPDQENEVFYSALLAAGVGADTVSISYLNDDGAACEVTVPRIGAYYNRLKDTVALLDQGFDAGNLTWTKLDDETALLRIRTMMYDSESYASTDHTKMQAELREELLSLKQEGITNLIIDIRSNGGGSPHMAMAIAGLFAEEGTHFYLNSGEWDETTGLYKLDSETGKYRIGESLSYTGEDLWAEGQIVLLVNAECISAADHFVMLMDEMDNVTTMGFTKSGGAGQAVNSVALESGSLTFSAIPAMDEDGNIIIDSDTSRIIGIGVDELVPFDEEAVRVLFDDGGDYLLQRAAAYLQD